MGKPIQTIFRNKGVPVVAPMRRTVLGHIEDISRSNKAISVRGNWYVWDDNTTCRKLKRIDGTWSFCGAWYGFVQFDKGIEVEISYLRYRKDKQVENFMINVGIVERELPEGNKAIHDLYGENLSKAEIFAGEPEL